MFVVLNTVKDYSEKFSSNSAFLSENMPLIRTWYSGLLRSLKVALLKTIKKLHFQNKLMINIALFIVLG